jgi:putative transposase
VSRSISFCGGSNRDPIFGNDEDVLFFKECLLDAAKRHDLAVHAYMFMTNHIHLLASPGSEESVPKTMQSVGRRYVQYFNWHYKRTGTLWEGRYRATVVEAENYLVECMRYVPCACSASQKILFRNHDGSSVAAKSI